MIESPIPDNRPELKIIADWIEPGSRVLDLGCGSGLLLAHLAAHRQVRGYGLELNLDKITSAIERGVNVIQADLNDGLDAFGTDSFDYVIMSLTLQALARPDWALEQMLRIGRTCIVTFPNFGHWRVRAALAQGRMPVTPALPATWYDTANIHLCTVEDFEALCADKGWRTLQRSLLDKSHHEGWKIRLWPNLFSEIAIYMLQD